MTQRRSGNELWTEGNEPSVHSILKIIDDALLVIDSQDHVVLANDSARRLFKLDPARQDINIAELLDNPAALAAIKELRRIPESVARTFEHRVNRQTGQRIYKLTLHPLPEPSHDLVNVAALFRDITREKQAAQTNANHLSNVSHELRTPLASIRAYAEMLVDGEAANEKTRSEFYEIILSESNRLERLIDTILNISRIETGLVKANRVPLSLVLLVKDAIVVIGPQAQQKDITIVERLSPSIYQTLADRDMLHEAILNLLANAIKYTPQGGQITIETQLDESKNKAITHISDTGVGIPPKDLPFVFDRFYRSEANADMANGAGIGLSLVKHIIEVVHQGRLLVQSEAGSGSTFSFELDVIE